MRLIYEIVELVACFIEIYVLYLIYQQVLHGYRRISSRFPEIILSLVGVVVVRMCNQISVFTYFLTLFFVLYISFSSLLLYKIRYIVLVSIASFYFLCMVSFDFFIVSVLSALGGGTETFNELVSTPGWLRITMIVGIKICWIITFALLKEYLWRFSEIAVRGKQVFVISICGFLGLVFLAEQTFQSFNYKLTGAWFLLLIVCILLMFVFYFLATTREKKMKLDFAEERNKMLEKNYDSISDLYASNAKLYHDLNNHLNVLYQLLENGNSDEAKMYINEISKPISALEKITWTGMDVVDVVINSKLQAMNEKGIRADINVEFPANTGILSNDMCTILANILDNAIEAAENVEGERFISLIIRRINHFIMIKVTNPYQGTRSKFGDSLATTKKDKNMHGWGFASVRSTVEKYNGTFEYDMEENLFIVNIILCFRKETK